MITVLTVTVTGLDMDNKKGMEMGVQTLIYVAIGIAILAISLIVYFGVVSDGEKTWRSCENMGGSCQYPDAAACSQAEGKVMHFGRCYDAQEGNVCCDLR